MFKVSSRNNENWGIEGYEITKKHFDHNRIKKEREYAT
jgi:hypothetical protein